MIIGEILQRKLVDRLEFKSVLGVKSTKLMTIPSKSLDKKIWYWIRVVKNSREQSLQLTNWLNANVSEWVPTLTGIAFAFEEDAILFYMTFK